MRSTPATVAPPPVSSPEGERRRVIAMMALPLLGAGFTAGCSPKSTAPQVAPSFSYTLLDGTTAHSAALRGRVVLVNFWATTCAVCVKEMPELVALHQKFQPQGLHTLAVAVRYDPPALVADFAQSRRLPFDVVIDNTGAITDSFGSVRGTPTTFVIDRQGRVASRIEGAPDFKALQSQLAQLLAQA